MRRRYSVLCGLVALVILIAAPLSTLAGVTGKISGRVTDRSTGEPLPFANVLVVGTTMGAMTDLDGYFHILNVSPGTYEVEARMMGYNTLSQSSLVVITDQTTRADFQLSQRVIELEREVVVVGRKIVEPDVTESKTTISKETLAALPVDTFQEAFLTATSVVEDPSLGEMHVRGGRGGEVLYLVDGMPIKNPLVGGAAGIDISADAVEEMSITLGGFGAEYGNAQSGVVNLVTKEGDEHRHSGKMAYKTDDLGEQLDEYSFNTDRVEFSLSGPEPITSMLLPGVGLDLPGKLTYFVSADGEWTDTYNQFNSLAFPKYEMLDGRITLQDRQDNRNSFNTKLAYKMSPTKKLTAAYHQSYRFYLPSDYDQANAFRDIPMNWRFYKRQSELGTVTWNHTLTGNTFYEASVSRFLIDFSGQSGNTTPYTLNEYPETSDNPLDIITRSGRGNHGIDAMDEPFIEIPRYDGEIDNPDAPSEDYLDLNGDGLYSPGEPFFDEAVSNGHYDVGEQFRDFTGDGIWSGDEPDSAYDVRTGSYNVWSAYDPNTDYNLNGVQDSLVQDGYYDYGYDQWCPWRRRHQEIWTGKLDVTSQVTKEHMLKTGLELRYYEAKMIDIQYPYEIYEEYEELPEGDPYRERGIFRDIYYVTPTAGCVYFQDKIETEGMIVKAGIRYDFWYPGEQVSEFEDPITESMLSTEWRSQISPRLGISHPITERDKLYFAYGLYSQVPELQYIYHSTTQGSSALNYYGNPDLRPERTSSYELGVQHQFNRDVALDFTGFFKDVRGLVDMEKRGEPPNDGHVFSNLDWGNTRGMEFKLIKRHSNYTAGSISYTLQWAMGKSSSDRQNYDYDNEGHPRPIREYPLDWDQRHAVSINTEFSIAEGESPSILGLKLPDRSGISLLWQYGSGLPWTANEIIKKPHETENARRLPSTNTLDLKAWKRFNFGPLTYGFELEVLNVTDKKNVLAVHDDSGLPGEGLGLMPPGINSSVFDEEGISRIKPHNYGPGRQILASVEVSF